MIEIGEYVRTCYGEIHKVVNIVKDDVDWNYYLYDNNMGDLQLSILKHSKRLIDLIENKDILKVKSDKTVMFFGIDENTSDIRYEELIKNIENGEYELLGILTKEQMEANCYKVGEEDE